MVFRGKIEIRIITGNIYIILTMFIFLADEFNRDTILSTIIKQLKSIMQPRPDDGPILKASV